MLLVLSNIPRQIVRCLMCLLLPNLLACSSYSAVANTASGQSTSEHSIPPSSIQSLRNTLAEHVYSADRYGLMTQISEGQDSDQNQFEYADHLWAKHSDRTRLSDEQLHQLKTWLANPNNFDDQVEKRCQPGKSIGLVFLLSDSSPIKNDVRSVIDLHCASIRFYDANGKWMNSTYFDPSIELINDLLKSGVR